MNQNKTFFDKENFAHKNLFQIGLSCSTMKFLFALLAIVVFASCEFNPETFDWSTVKPITETKAYREAFPERFLDVPINEDARIFDRNGRILRGRPASPTDFPHSVGVLISFEIESGWCSGSLVSRSYVMTAAQCFIGAETMVTALLGASDISRVNDFILSFNYITHPQFNQNNYDHDLALVQLSRQAQLNEFVQIIRVPNLRQVGVTFEKQKVFVAGWGSLTGGNEAIPVQQLHSIQASVITNTACRIRHIRLRDFHLCTDVEVGAPCTGDEGSGLFITEFDNQRTLIGIYSWQSETLIRGCDRGFPPVYTRITNYLFRSLKEFLVMNFVYLSSKRIVVNMKLIILATFLYAFVSCEINLNNSFDWSTVKPLWEIKEWREAHPERAALLSGSKSPRMPRIINGELANPNDFPYVAGVLLHFDTGNSWCGGSLISRRFVLTAANCVHIVPSSSVLLGASNVHNVAENIRVLTMRVHPLYNFDQSLNDIATLELSRTVDLSSTITLVRLPNRRQVQVTFENQQSTVSGWGRTSTSGSEPIPTQFLRFFRSPVMTNLACRIRYPTTIVNSHVCTDPTVGTPCTGDEGGPLMIVEADGRNTQIGIFSSHFSLGCGLGWPGVKMKLLILLLGFATSAFAFSVENVDYDKLVPVHETKEWKAAFPTLAKQLTLSDGTNRNGRIWGGRQAAPGELPYQVGIVVLLAQQGFCGGSIVSENFVLTAAQCFPGDPNAVVEIGSVDRNAVTEFINAAVKILHPLFNPETSDNDIALVRLVRPITFNDNKRPVRLPNRRQVNQNFDNRQARFSGWGAMGFPGTSPIRFLQVAFAQVISQAACRIRFPNSSSDRTICIDGTTTNICSGDFGGPMTIEDADGITTQIGVASFVNVLGCTFGWPGGFTRINQYLEWIGQNSDVVIRDDF
ncbi:CLUMA_CG004155, isoform A [Clunio marinus]|uniref:CLUMA_CG004155, isoform A n=1 Tax=Clunio marinus TaxID=568069 RepID=A0A1J1HVJ4_9DIPT|nr:CLUMA_CG004155, isoform A [Clunio marinus]